MGFAGAWSARFSSPVAGGRAGTVALAMLGCCSLELGVQELSQAAWAACAFPDLPRGLSCSEHRLRRDMGHSLSRVGIQGPAQLEGEMRT